MDHPTLVKALAKPGQEIRVVLTGNDCHLWHMASCVCGEAGELLDAIKKSVIYRKGLDRENVIEELGDLEFYLEGLRQGLSITRDETIQHNINKLSKRYGEKYSDAAAQARADKMTNYGVINFDPRYPTITKRFNDCRLRRHNTSAYHSERGLSDYTCLTCGYTYQIDSSD